MKIAIFGLGYVGIVSSACLSKLGHEVIGVDIVQSKVDSINNGESPLVEPQLTELIKEMTTAGKLSATTSVQDAIEKTELALICVGTPSTLSGGLNISHVNNVISQIGDVLQSSTQSFYTVVIRSTVLPSEQEDILNRLLDTSKRTLGDNLGYAYHPEFLREGTAIKDFYEPPKIVYGCTDKKSIAVCKNLYPGIDVPSSFVSPKVAATVKYADNCFHALKITFANEIGMICKKIDIDSRDVMSLFCTDKKLNISTAYLRPGAPFGGSCLPKDLNAILDLAREINVPIPALNHIKESRQKQLQFILEEIAQINIKSVGIIGLTFKEHTDDLRESPMVSVAETMIGKGYKISIYDPTLVVNKMIGSNKLFALKSISHLEDLIVNDLQAVVDQYPLIVISHRLNDETWEKITFTEDSHIYDLVGIDCLKNKKNYKGLYW